MIASGMCLLIWGKTMAEDSLGLVLLQHVSFFDNCILITQSAVFVNEPSYTFKYWSEISKSRLQIRATLD